MAWLKLPRFKDLGVNQKILVFWGLSAVTWLTAYGFAREYSRSQRSKILESKERVLAEFGIKNTKD